MQLMSRFAVPLALLLLVLAAPVTAQAPSPTTTDATPPSRHPEEGKPFIRNYPPDVYGGGGQNWGMVQDARGVIYIGGSRGVLEYDGVSWRLIATPTQTVVRSVALGATDASMPGRPATSAIWRRTKPASWRTSRSEV